MQALPVHARLGFARESRRCFDSSMINSSSRLLLLLFGVGRGGKEPERVLCHLSRSRACDVPDVCSLRSTFSFEPNYRLTSSGETVVSISDTCQILRNDVRTMRAEPSVQRRKLRHDVQFSFGYQRVASSTSSELDDGHGKRSSRVQESDRASLSGSSYSTSNPRFES